MTLTCITNEMPDIRSCTSRGQHTVRCDGNEYTWNATREREEATGKVCAGCLPRVARVGLLCFACWEQVQQALSDWPVFEERLSGVDRAVQRDNGGVRGATLGYVPMSALQLAINEIWSYVRTMGSLTAIQWVASDAGAKNAVRFARAMATALRTHAHEEKARALRRVRCPDCNRLSFVHNPPTYEGALVTVHCQNERCGKTIHEGDTTIGGAEKLAVVADIEQHTSSKVNRGLRATGGRDEFAEPYNPNRPEHADLDPYTLKTVLQLRRLLPPETPRLRSLRKAELIEAVKQLGVPA